jgi:hypothetical protein
MRVLSVIMAGLLLAACSDTDLNINVPDNKVRLPLLEVYAPENGAVLPANQPFVLDYEVVQGSGGDHVKVQIDDRPPLTVHQIFGRHQMEPLPAGKHILIITEYTRAGQPTGAKALIHITMQ